MTVPEHRVVPALRMTNYARSKAFYVDRIGFSVEWEHRFEPHFPVFMSVARDGMRLYLSEHAGDCQVGGLVHFSIPDVDAGGRASDWLQFQFADHRCGWVDAAHGKSGKQG